MLVVALWKRSNLKSTSGVRHLHIQRRLLVVTGGSSRHLTREYAWRDTVHSNLCFSEGSRHHTGQVDEPCEKISTLDDALLKSLVERITGLGRGVCELAAASPFHNT